MMTNMMASIPRITEPALNKKYEDEKKVSIIGGGCKPGTISAYLTTSKPNIRRNPAGPKSAKIDPASASPHLFLFKAWIPPIIAIIHGTIDGAPNISVDARTTIQGTATTIPPIIQSMPAVVGFHVFSIFHSDVSCYGCQLR